MNARLVLARHGNTFEPDTKPYWVGARSDLSLVSKGREQAEHIGSALRDARVTPSRILCGPLQRTLQTTALALASMGKTMDGVIIDDRLKEIDYGAWEGKSTDDITAMGDGAELAAWNNQSTFPASRGWQPHEAQITANVALLMAEAKEATTLIVTSNGILRFFARAASNSAQFAPHKVLPGHICVMLLRDHDWAIQNWNKPPHDAFVS